ncbi:hypothetical protein QBC46DRAFT_404837 [Diplogelasinospora grovesii]|uniref:Uncharacterized protein n=1 Tax=Diplogelasinospora grovesii TaxID=303347 RepID=A0AAN6NDV5_9PEZI|nr:hypothetical protein QBC46DRAFT_404837 [Diplogelasinospora grovesii]
MRKTAKTSSSVASSSRPRVVHHQELRSGDFEESVFESEFEEQFEEHLLFDDAESDEADTFSYPGTKRVKTVSCRSSPLKRSATKFCLSGLKGKEKRVEPGRAVIEEDEDRAGVSGLLSRSKPIAIESPSHRSRSDSPEPLEHLSARGDIAGAFFPEHEDTSSRVHKPHHFARDARKAKHQSLAEAAQAAETFSFSSDDSIWKGKDTVVPVYLLKAPGFEHLGLYYPQNWTWRKQQKEERRRRRREEEDQQRRQRKSTTAKTTTTTTATTTATTSSSGAAATTRAGAEPRTARPRYPAAVFQICSISDARRGPGQQCQRNMVAQVAVDSTAVMKVRGDCGISANGSSSVSAATTALKTIILKRCSKPLSPRLTPLDDHGPVTPMNLEEERGGTTTSYLSSGATAVDTTPQSAALPATKDRKGKGKADSPPQSNTRKGKGKERAFF